MTLRAATGAEVARVASDHSADPWPWRHLLACAATAAAVLAVGLLLGGGAPRPAPAGLPDAGPLTGWGLPLVRLLCDGAAVVAAGSLLAALLLPCPGDLLDGIGLRAVRAASTALAVAAVAALVQLLLTVSDFLAIPPAAALHPATLWALVAHTVQGSTLALQTLLALVVAGAVRLQRRASGVWLLLPAALGVAAAPALDGHTTGAGNHLMAEGSLLVHLLAATLWVGGLGGLAAIARGAAPGLAAAVPRYSRLALWCAIAVAASGVADGWIGIGSLAAVGGSGYGRLLLAKAAALSVLVWYGWTHRRRTVPRLACVAGADGDPTDAPAAAARRVFVRLAAAELLIMAAAYGLAVALSRTPTPVPR